MATSAKHQLQPKVWMKHAERRHRTKQLLNACRERIRVQSSVMSAVGLELQQEDDEAKDPELVARLRVLAPCISAQMAAEARGEEAHSSRRHVPRDVHAMGIGARHIFQKPMDKMTPSLVRAMQRGQKTKAKDDEKFDDKVRLDGCVPPSCLTTVCPGCKLFFPVEHQRQTTLRVDADVFRPSGDVFWTELESAWNNSFGSEAEADSSFCQDGDGEWKVKKADPPIAVCARTGTGEGVDTSWTDVVREVPSTVGNSRDREEQHSGDCEAVPPTSLSMSIGDRSCEREAHARVCNVINLKEPCTAMAKAVSYEEMLATTYPCFGHGLVISSWQQLLMRRLDDILVRDDTVNDSTDLCGCGDDKVVTDAPFEDKSERDDVEHTETKQQHLKIDGHRAKQDKMREKKRLKQKDRRARKSIKAFEGEKEQPLLSTPVLQKTLPPAPNHVNLAALRRVRKAGGHGAPFTASWTQNVMIITK